MRADPAATSDHFPFIAAAATERGLPVWAVGAAKRKPVLGVGRQFDDR
jgi:hypothetical protein